MSVLEIENLRFNYSDKELFNDCSLRLFAEDHLGLVGINGSGKSTLMNLITGKLDPDSGKINWTNGITYSYLDQHLKVFDDYTIQEYLYGVYQKLFEEEQRMNDLYVSLETALVDDYDKILKKTDSIQNYLEENEFYSIKSKIGSVINGLGINISGTRVLRELSGGQRAKVFLAKMLLEEQDVLLLDEPTNFLDKSHIEWLTKFLQSYQKAFIIISHNLEFLNNVCNCICELTNKQLTKYRGNYQNFLSQKEMNDKTYQKQFEAQQKYIKKTQEFIDKNIVRATTTKRAQSRQKALEKIQIIEKPHVDKKVHFQFLFTSSFNNEAVKLNKLEIGYTFPLLPMINYKIRFGEKIVIVGKNGIGKSTLIKTILGIIRPINGDIWLNPLNKISYFSQEMDVIPEITPVQFIKNDYPLMEDKAIRDLLGKYGISGELAKRNMNHLSGGELTKVRFARLNLEKSNLLILDEPTNHLDRIAKESLFNALSKYPGTIILVSHEQEFYSKLKMKELKFE